MKKIIVFLMLLISTNVTLADENKLENKFEISISSIVNIENLKPVVPLEATFEETDIIDIEKLKPTTPKDAFVDEIR